MVPSRSDFCATRTSTNEEANARIWVRGARQWRQFFMPYSDCCRCGGAVTSSPHTKYSATDSRQPSIMSSYLKSVREWATPTLKSSAFLSRGVLTPEEFVAAGDELVYKCPTWSWEGGDPSKAKNYLPPNKQYLVTRNVPCPTRVSALENSIATGGAGTDGTAHIDDECDGEDWLVSRIVSAEEQAKIRDQELEDEFDILDDEGETMQAVEDKMSAVAVGGDDAAAAGGEEQDDDDEYADMADFEDDNVLIEDEAAVPAPKESASAGADDNIRKVRTYDLSITYDKYYQTPRVWMMGYSADSMQPLTGAEMMQDVMSDYANRTVTIETHPHVSGPHASIHPCQHGAVMKTIVRNLMSTAEDGSEGGGGGGAAANKAPSIEMYLFIFLKFVSSIIPTMNYDFTMDVTASTKK